MYRKIVARASDTEITDQMVKWYNAGGKPLLGLKRRRCAEANMFLSDIFRNTLAGVSGATIELYETDGSVGAAKGAGIGCGLYKNSDEAFATLKKLAVIEPDEQKRNEYLSAYAAWKEMLEKATLHI